MDSFILREAVEYLLTSCFRSKKEIASEIGVSYRSLLNCCNQKGTYWDINIVSAKLIRYCVEKQITLHEAINLSDGG